MVINVVINVVVIIGVMLWFGVASGDSSWVLRYRKSGDEIMCVWDNDLVMIVVGWLIWLLIRPDMYCIV